ncbi:MAG: FAD-dependent oxidoreductase, partial [Pseudomonadota bacterium]
IGHLPRNMSRHHASHHESLLAMLRHLVEKLEKAIADEVRETPALRHAYQIADMITAVFTALLGNWSEIDEHGLDIFDDLDFQAFLKKHGCADINADVRTCGPLRDLYNLAFAFENGDPERPNLAAGVAMRGAVAILFCYKDAPAQKMMAGMGDTIFTPFYRVAQQRGVKVKFFHRLEEITWAEDGGKQVDALRFGIQATPKTGDYDPFVTIKGLDCWPQAPLTDQLNEGEAILKGPNGDGVAGWDGDWKGYDLEDFWTTWENVDEVTLKRGEDFDLVILAIPPASHQFFAQSLVDASPAWSKMTEDVVAIRTLAAQLWMKPDLAATGWPHGETLVAAYQEPFDTWIDMAHLISVEDWPSAETPGGINYLCGTMKGGLPPRDEVGVTERADAEVEKIANDWLSTASGALWPDISDGGALKPGQTVVRDDDAGEGYMKGQFWRGNVSPSELYVASHAGTIASRLDADESGFENLIFAGDWTRNGLNAGCVEASVMSGLRASNAVCGSPALDDIVSYWSGAEKKETLQ